MKFEIKKNFFYKEKSFNKQGLYIDDEYVKRLLEIKDASAVEKFEMVFKPIEHVNSGINSEKNLFVSNNSKFRISCK